LFYWKISLSIFFEKKGIDVEAVMIFYKKKVIKSLEGRERVLSLHSQLGNGVVDNRGEDH